MEQQVISFIKIKYSGASNISMTNSNSLVIFQRETLTDYATSGHSLLCRRQCVARVEIDVFEGAEWLKLNDSIPPAAAPPFKTNETRLPNSRGINSARFACELTSGIFGCCTFGKNIRNNFCVPCCCCCCLAKCRQPRMQ